MKITAVKLYILEHPDRKGSGHKLVQVPNLRRIQYTHKGLPSDQLVQQTFIQVETDAGITGRCTTTMSPAQAAIVRNQVLGEDPLDREKLYQMLHKGTRWVYQPPRLVWRF